MAESILSELLKKLGTIASNEIRLVRSAKKDIEKLQDTVETIRAVLVDAEEQRERENAVRVWLEKIEDALYDADDLLDEFSTDLLQRQMVTTRNKKKVRIFFSHLKQIAFRYKMGRRVKAINERLEAIESDMNKFDLMKRSLGLEPRAQMKVNRETHSFVPAVDVIGRDNDRRKVIEYLLNEDVQNNVSVVSIVGIGGLGKTTLAQLVYNDDEVKSQFDLKMWVCVSDVVFDVKNVALKILDSIGQNLQMDQVQRQLREKMDGKKYLLVLDDVWNEDRIKWLDLECLLRDGVVKGSKILVTTRKKIVAETTDTKLSSLHILKGLSDNE